MADTLTKTERSDRMRLIRSSDTKPERVLRKMLSANGYRYRLNSRVLPGHPDVVFPGQRKVIFVHGCFWHRHQHCRLARLPKSKLDYWAPKLEANKMRDALNRRRLKRLGWRVLVVWECELVNLTNLENRLNRFLKQSS